MDKFTILDIQDIIGKREASNLMISLQKKVIPMHIQKRIVDNNGMEKLQTFILFDVDKVLNMYEKKLKSFGVLEKTKVQWKQDMKLIEGLK